MGFLALQIALTPLDDIMLALDRPVVDLLLQRKPRLARMFAELHERRRLQLRQSSGMASSSSSISSSRTAIRPQVPSPARQDPDDDPAL